MTADEFLKVLEANAPTLQDLMKQGLEKSEALEFLKEMTPVRRRGRKEQSDPLLALLAECDVRTLGLGWLDLDARPREYKSFVVVGTSDGMLLAISRPSGQIVLLDDQTGREVMKCARDSSSFLDALSHWVIHNRRGMRDARCERSSSKAKNAQECGALAGGRPFARFFRMMHSL